MPPNTTDDLVELERKVPLVDKDRKIEVIYSNVMVFLYFHLAGLYGLYLCFTTAKWGTVGLAFLLLVAGNLGITAGAHRLWAHRSYKAKLPLQIILIILNSIAFQNTALHWARDHRLHHKFSDTEADPHNSRRGFFYSHMGWLLTKKGEQVRTQGSKISMDDLHANKVVMFQKKYAIPVIGTICFLLPTVIPAYYWGESLWYAWHVNMMRYAIGLNTTFLVNSAAHAFGYRPYDNNLPAKQNIAVSITALGEGFHNYHHAFPWDYRTAELGNNALNVTTKFIDFFAWIGWAYDLKTTTNKIVDSKMTRSGDGTDLWGRKIENKSQLLYKRQGLFSLTYT